MVDYTAACFLISVMYGPSLGPRLRDQIYDGESGGIRLSVPIGFSNFTRLDSGLLARNFYLQKNGTTTDQQVSSSDPSFVSLGVWHVLPETVSKQLTLNDKTSPADMDESMREGNESIILYFHGTRGNRTYPSCTLYNNLANAGYHVVAIDFRGFGDSTGDKPNELQIMEDVHTIYEHVRKSAPNKGIAILGQSMGSIVATRLAAELSNAGTPPRALILTAPFSTLFGYNYLAINASTAAYDIAALAQTSCFDSAFDFAMKSQQMECNSTKYIKNVICPILAVANSADNAVYWLPDILVKSAREANRSIEYIKFDDPALGHGVHLSPEIPGLIHDFLDPL
ncbi:serine aminopeptidase, s33 domain-containing protein [Ditylenchus destructor]|uniref:Serine aminopeptidase, s33 domain-containing protein n=1 Tax=Ditylenchus destructor TaxID=166010 RepID=A0AAD4MNM4_9BILA|nr:serine aminopeptidase, s33 domain-containing protein [Ditylenchus destructor]